MLLKNWVDLYISFSRSSVFSAADSRVFVSRCFSEGYHSNCPWWIVSFLFQFFLSKPAAFASRSSNPASSVWIKEHAIMSKTVETFNIIIYLLFYCCIYYIIHNRSALFFFLCETLFFLFCTFLDEILDPFFLVIINRDESFCCECLFGTELLVVLLVKIKQH